MTDTTEATAKTVAVAKEIGVIAAKSAASAAVEVVAATTILIAFGYGYSKLQERRAKKALVTEVK